MHSKVTFISPSAVQNVPTNMPQQTNSTISFEFWVILRKLYLTSDQKSSHGGTCTKSTRYVSQCFFMFVVLQRNVDTVFFYPANIAFN